MHLDTIKSAEKFKIVPLRDFVLIKPILPEATTTKSGLYIPEDASEGVAEIKGTILAIGSNVKTNLAVGDEVIFNNRVKIRIKGELYSFVKEENIIGIIKHEPKG